MQTCVDCRFCGISKGYYNYLGVDEPIYSNQDFFVIASIGALIEGWTLIVPQNHHFSMKRAYHADLINDALNAVLPRLKKQYGANIIAFEHGANSDESTTACGTSHAHLHLVPYQGTLVPHLRTSSLDWSSCSFSEISSTVGDSEYLFYSDLSNKQNLQDTKGLLHILKAPTSQFFRNIIAEQCGKKELANYKTHPFLDVAEKTRSALVSI